MVLVTGGAGYIGNIVVRKLLEEGVKVKVFDKLYFGKESILDIEDKIEIIEGDLRDIKEEVLDGVGGVINMGSLSNDPTADFNPKVNWEINYEGTIKLAKLCKKKRIKKFTQASSCAIYGFHISGIADEKFPPNPQSVYAKSKLKAEEDLIKLKDENFSPVIFRQGTVYGASPRMRYDLVVNTMVRDAFFKKKIFVYGDGEIWRPLIDINDVAEAHILAMMQNEKKLGGEIFNLVYKNYKIIDLAKEVREIINKYFDVDIEFLKNMKDTRSYRVAGEKIKDVLNFKPKVSIEDAVKKMVEIIYAGKFTDFDNPIYYNIEWMKLKESW